MSMPAQVQPANPTLPDLLADQRGIATREQLLSAGLSESRLTAELAGRRWRQLNEHVIATPNGPLTRSKAMWAVVLSAPPPAALCSLTVYELYGVPSGETEVIHV